MAATEIVAVLDAGSLIHLDELGRLNLLNDFKELLKSATRFLISSVMFNEQWHRVVASRL